MFSKMDPMREAKLIAAELQYYNRPFAMRILQLGTFMLAAMAALFSLMFFLSAEEAGGELLFFSAAMAGLITLVVAVFWYGRQKRQQWPTYILYMHFTAILYLFCAFFGFLLTRALWIRHLVQEVGEESTAAYYLRTWTLCWIFPCAALAFYWVMLRWYKARDPYSRAGNFYPFNFLAPFLCILLLLFALSVRSANNILWLSSVTSACFIGIMLYFAVRFLLKSFLYKKTADRQQTPSVAEQESSAQEEQRKEDMPLAEDEILSVKNGFAEEVPSDKNLCDQEIEMSSRAILEEATADKETSTEEDAHASKSDSVILPENIPPEDLDDPTAARASGAEEIAAEKPVLYPPDELGGSSSAKEHSAASASPDKPPSAKKRRRRSKKAFPEKDAESDV